MKTKVIVDPSSNIVYSSFYLLGLWKVYGKSNVKFSLNGFSQIQGHALNFNYVIHSSVGEERISIDMDDSTEIKMDLYSWCDVYAKVNTNWHEIPTELQKKVVSIPPGFGVRIWGLCGTIFHALNNYRIGKTNLNMRKFLGKYKKLIQIRMPLSSYEYIPSNQKYIFHVSTLWQSDENVRNDERVNRIRAKFIEVCRNIPEIQFEGGLHFGGGFSLNPQFEPYIFKEYISNWEYIEKIKASILVFNTPAWLNCHGWKLGEYLAMGKAIISTPFYNNLPEELEHGVNIHFINDSEEDMKAAIELIIHDNAYREKLENGALAYWSKWCTPQKVIENLQGR
jgi:hypothetical protein